MSCSVDNDPSLCYFSLAVLNSLGYGVEKTDVWVHQTCLDFAAERIKNWIVDPESQAKK